MLASCLALLALPVSPAPPPLTHDRTGIDPAAEDHVLFLRADRLVVRPGVELEGAAVLIQDGVILDVGSDLQAPEGARVLEGAVVCAGFLDPWSVLGLDEGSAGDPSTSASTRSADGLDFYSAPLEREAALRAGVTAVRAQVGVHARFGGIGAVVRTAGRAGGSGAVVLEDSCVNAAVAVTRDGRTMDVFERAGEVDRVISTLESGRSYLESQIEYEHELEEWRKAIAEKEKELEKDFKKAKKDRDKEIEKAEEKGKEHKEKRYKEEKKPKAPRYNPDDEVMARVANGELPLVVEVHRAVELKKLLEGTEKFDRLRLVLAGGTEAMAVADVLAERQIPVIVRPVPMGAERDSEYQAADLGLAGELDGAGVPVLLGSGPGQRGATRDLPLMAALAVGHGLDTQAAFHALTLGAARALDVSDRLGSIELGKDADLLVLDGDPLSSTTRVQYVISGGEVVVEP